MSLLQRKKNAVRKFYWNQTYNGRMSAQCILVLRLHSAQTLTSVPAFYRQKEWIDRAEENYDRLWKIYLNSAFAKFYNS